MSAKSDYLIWWIDVTECAALYRGATRRSWPNYIGEQVSSMSGRWPRGRLWSSASLGNTPEVDEVDWHGRAAELANTRGGIVIRKEDYPHVENLVGYVTDFHMRPLNLDDAFVDRHAGDGEGEEKPQP